MRRLLVAALALLAGCVDFVDVTAPDYVHVGYSAASVDLDVSQPVDGRDSVRVTGWIGVQATQLQLVDDSLRVLGRALRPVRGTQGIDLRYDSTFLLAPGTLDAGVVAVKLPVVKGVDFFPAAFLAPVFARSGPAKLSIAQGSDLVLPLARAAAPPELGPTLHEFWQLDLIRGRHVLNINSSGAVPARVVVPASSIPADTARTLHVQVTALRGFRPESRGDSSYVSVSTRSSVHWTVQVTP